MEPLRPDQVPNPAVRRLSLYLRQLETFHRAGRHTISSRQLGDSLGYTDAQVRKDLAYFGQFGQPGIGYRVAELIPHLRHILGTDRTWSVLLVGAGNLGRALAAYRGFEARGFRLAAVFDADPAKVGTTLAGLSVRPMGELSETVRALEIRLAIVAVPTEAAQDVADALAEAGIAALLNFAPTRLNVPRHVAVGSVDLAVHLEQLSFQVNVQPPARR